MELRHLRYFCAVAEEMHVTRAAARLRLAQPALTQQIKSLENELQTPLLRHVGRRIVLTPAGVTFWHEAKAILARVRAATLITQETARGLSGSLSIGLVETASYAQPVTDVLKRARELWPTAQFGLVQARSADLVPALIERQIDVAFVRSPIPENPILESHVFLTEGMAVAMPRSHPLASRRSIPLSALIDESLILPHRPVGEGLWAQLNKAFASLSKPLRIVQETPDYGMAINFVAASLGITLVPAVLAGLRSDAVTYRPLTFKPPLRTQILLAARRGEASPIAVNFLALASEAALHLSETRRTKVNREHN